MVNDVMKRIRNIAAIVILAGVGYFFYARTGKYPEPDPELWKPKCMANLRLLKA